MSPRAAVGPASAPTYAHDDLRSCVAPVSGPVKGKVVIENGEGMRDAEGRRQPDKTAVAPQPPPP